MNRMHAKESDAAVSPVIGVMLMLVVTIVVAALVAVFASGVMTETSPSPVMTFKGTYSQTNGLVLTHTGGDDVAGFAISVRPSTGFGESYYKLSWTPDISEVSGKTQDLAKTIWSAGQTVIVAAADIQPATEGSVNSGNNKGESGYYGFNNVNNVGRYMTVELLKDGKVFAMAEVKIAA